MLPPSYGYLQTRLQARHAGRLSTAEWQRLASTTLLGSYLQGIRRTPLEPWVRGLSDTVTHHGIELSLRARWRQYVAELARWPPPAWHAAVTWTDRLWDLPVALELARDGQMGSWTRDDPVHSLWLDREGVDMEAVARHLGPSVVAACVEGRDVVVAWCAVWRELWPEMPVPVRAGLEKLIKLIAQHREAMARVTDLRLGSTLRGDLEPPLVRLFRSYARTPVALFAYLSLTALQLEQLRAALVRRALFAPGERS